MSETRYHRTASRRPVCHLPQCVATPADRSYGKTALMKALLHLRNGKNETVELLIDISEKMGDIKEFVNAAYTNNYYKGKLCT